MSHQVNLVPSVYPVAGQWGPHFTLGGPFYHRFDNLLFSPNDPIFSINSVSEIRWRAERGFDRVPDEFGSVPANSLPIGDLRARDLRRKGLPRTTERR